MYRCPSCDAPPQYPVATEKECGCGCAPVWGMKGEGVPTSYKKETHKPIYIGSGEDVDINSIN
jgi:hypothetical protein